MTRVAVDALGGDRAPEEVVAGALEAAQDGIEPILFGPADLDAHGLPLVDASLPAGLPKRGAKTRAEYERGVRGSTALSDTGPGSACGFLT